MRKMKVDLVLNGWLVASGVEIEVSDEALASMEACEAAGGQSDVVVFIRDDSTMVSRIGASKLERGTFRKKR